MMQATEMNHLLNMLTLAPLEETEPRLGNVNKEQQEVSSAWNCLCLSLGRLKLEVTSQFIYRPLFTYRK